MHIHNTITTKTLKKLSGCAALFLLLALLAAPAWAAAGWTPPHIEKPAQHPNYPERPIDFICGWGVGGGADSMSRKIAELARKHYGVRFVVTSMSGAAGVKGIDYAMRQPHDGHTVFFAAWDAYMNYLLKKMVWKPEQISLLVQAQVLPGAYFVHADSPFKTWQDVIDYSKKHPYKLKVADVGRGGLGDLTLALWEQKTGLKLTYVPFDAPTQRYAAFSGRHTDLLYEQPGDIPAILEAGARALVFMAEERHPDFPDVPTARELGHDITIALWRGVAVAEDTPPDIKQYLTELFKDICTSPEYIEFLNVAMALPGSMLFGGDAQKMFMDEYRLVGKMMNISR